MTPEKVLEHLVHVYGLPIVVYWLQRIAGCKDGQFPTRRDRLQWHQHRAYEKAVRKLADLAELAKQFPAQ